MTGRPTSLVRAGRAGGRGAPGPADALCLLLALVACIERPPTPRHRRQSFDRSALASVLVERPAPAHRVEARLGGAITYLGSDVEPDPVRAGQDAWVTFYFRADDELDEDWEVFVHAEDGQGGRFANLDHKPAGGRYPVGVWRRGDVVRDTFRVPVPPGASEVLLWSGFWFPPRDERLPLDDPRSVINDGNNRILAARLSVHP